MRQKFSRSERGWWLAAFVGLSLLLHAAILYGSRGWSLVGTAPVVRPHPGEVIVALQPPVPAPQSTPGGTHRAEPKPAPVKEAVPKPAHNDVPVPFQAHQRVLRGVAPRPAPHPVSRTDRSERNALQKPLPVPADRTPQIAGGKFPDRDLKPLPLGVETGDKLLTPKPLPRVLKETASNLKQLGPQEVRSGSGSAPGPKPTQVANRDSEMLPAGNGGATSGQGAPVGRSTGSGADEGGRGGGMTRGLPFGDPGGVLQGGDQNGGGGHGGGPGGPGSGNAYGGGGGAGAPVHVVYLVDVSESMRDDDKIGKARAALRQALSELQPEDSFDLIYFADDQHVFSGRRLAPATPENIARAGSYLANLRPRGATNLSAAIDRALSLPDVSHIVLISDGEPTLGVGTELDEKAQEVVIDDDALLEWVRRRNREGVHILTIDLGVSDQFEGTELLHDMAAQNGGKFLAINVSRLR